MILLALLFACSDPAPSGPAPRRVDVVKAAPADEADIQRFCDIQPTGDDAPLLQLPPLADEPASKPTGWRWLNVWATWCGPCVEELPLLGRWETSLRAGGTDVDLQLLTFDAEAVAVERFVKKHPELSPLLDGGMRIRSTEDIGPWLATLGLPPSSAIPLHVFADPQGRVRCIRSSAIGSHDERTVAALLR